MKNFIKTLSILVLCLNTYIVEAQQSDTLEIQRNEMGKVNFARFKPNPIWKMQNAVNFLKVILQMDTLDELHLIRDTTDKLNISHRLYQQYYRGIKVENAEYLVHGKNGIIESINGDFQDVKLPTTTPAINEQEALSKALSFVNAKEYKWEDSASERFIKQNTNKSNATYYPEGELVITKDLLKGGKNLKLAWKFTISSLIPNNEQWVYVDAISGIVIRVTPLIEDVNTPCTAQTKYSGILGITGDSFAGNFRLRENRNGVNVQTMNCLNQSNYANAIDFTNSNTSWTTGSWPNIGQDQVALDAHWGAEMVLDYWRIVQNRNSLNNSGMQILGYVHYFQSNPLLGWPNNAEWDQVNHVILYGDGDGITTNPFTCLDIVGHEMGHGITQFTASLSPGTQESGALNEGFSDIWGACIEHRSAPLKQTWLMGEELFNGTFTCVRNLQNPKSLSTFEGQHPDTYHGHFWDLNGNSHTNSTVLSHWFYLLSHGDNGTNDIGSTYNVSGIGIDEAQLIAYRTELLYLTSSADYMAARNGSIQATRDLYGLNSCEEIAATNAWYAVGVGAAYPGSTGLVISGDDIFCSTSNYYTIPNLPVGSTVTWSAIPNLVTFSCNPCTQTSLTKIANGQMTLTATISNACGSPLVINKQNITVGVSSVTGTYNSPTNSHEIMVPMGHRDLTTFNAACIAFQTKISAPGATSVYWSGPIGGDVIWSQSGGNVFCSFTEVGQTIVLTAYASNSLCTSYTNYRFKCTTTTTCGFQPYSVVISPNPAKTNMNVSLVQNNKTSVRQSFQKIRIINKMGSVKQNNQYNAGTKSVSVNISLLPPDVYTIQVFDGNTWYSEQFIKN